MLVALGVALLVAAAQALATAPGTDPLGAMVGYLQRAQNLDGGFGGAPGRPSDPGFTAWVAIALASAGVNPQDQAKPGGRDVHRYLLEHAGQLAATTDFERVALCAHAAGTSLRDFGGIDLVQRIVARQRPDGALAQVADGAASVNATIFAVIALSPVREPAVRARLEQATDWILAAQNPDGGWPAVVRGGPTDLDMTGAAIQALSAVGRHRTRQVAHAFALLRRSQRSDGGFPSMAHDPDTNSATTAWVVQGIWSAGGDPRDWRHPDSGADPLDFLASMQQPDGSIAWKRGNHANPLWMTAYAAPAYAGHPLPPPTAPRAIRPVDPPPADDDPPPPAAPPAADAGQGGDQSHGGGTALAGGGGRGAPLFSRPSPQSRGRTVGGARRLRDAADRDRRRSRRRAAHQQRTGAAAQRPRGAAGQRRRGAAGPPRTAAAGDRAAAVVEPVPGADRGRGDGSGVDPHVTGTVIGAADAPTTAGRGGESVAAPGIRGARAGGAADDAVALGLTGVLLVAAGVGIQLERRRPVP